MADATLHPSTTYQVALGNPQGPVIPAQNGTAPKYRSSSGEDLWALALSKLSEAEKRAIDFDQSDKLAVITNLLDAVKISEQKCISEQWQYKRKNGKGERVVLRDTFSKLVKWIQRFRDIGDIAVQYDPVHAALPWAGVRFLLEVAVGDFEKFAFMVEGAETIAYIIDRYAVFEGLYLRTQSAAVTRLKSSLTMLYAAVLKYLAKTKHYFEQSTPLRIIKGSLVSKRDIEELSESIVAAQNRVNDYAAIVDVEYSTEILESVATLSREHEDKYRRLKTLLEDIDAPIKRVSRQLQNIEDDLESKRRAKILMWLSPEPYIAHHSQNKRDVLSGTGQWLLKDSIHKQWMNDSSSSLIWLHGMSGTGKSKLVSIIIEDLVRQCDVDDRPQPVYFYCSRSNQETTRSDPRAILASLARQMSSLKPGAPILPPSLLLYRRKEVDGFASGSISIDESTNLIVSLTDYYAVSTIIVDALDECNPESRYQLLDALEDILQRSSGLVKIFVSSREEGDLVCELREYPSLRISSDKNSKDIELFVRTETTRLLKAGKLLRNSQAKDDLKEKIMTRLLEGANGMFRWVVMSLEALCAMKNDYDILARLGKLPRKLAVLYKEIYDDLFMHSYDVGQPLIKNTFKWLLCIRDSMSSHEFLAAIAQTVSPAPATLTREELLDLCCSFVAYDTGRDRFEFAHPSVREFLEGLPDYARTSSHAAAAECCLVYMIGRAESLKARNFLSERYSFSETNDRSIRDSFYSHGFGVYAARYGMLHCSAAKSARNCEPLQPVLETFLMDDSGWQSPLSWWMKQKVPDALRSNSLLDSLTGQSNSLHRAFVVACTFGFSEIVAHHLYSSLPEHTREQALVMSTLSRQDLITLQLLKPTMRYISSRNVLQHLLNRHTKLHPKLHPQQRLDRHSENIVQLTLSHCHSVAIDEDIIIYLCYYFPSIAPGFLLQYIQSETGEKVLLRTMELRSDDRIVEVISSTLQITQKMLRSALRNPGLTKRSLNMLESHTGPVETSIGLLDSVATCKSQEVLDEIFLRQGSLITPTMIEGLLKNNINLLDTLLIRHPDIRVTQDLVEVLLNETSLDSVSVFDILTRHSRRACYLTDDMIHKLAILIGAKMKAERRLVEEKIRLASDQCTPSRPPSLFKEIYWETERRGASLSRELLSKWTGLCGMKILEVILDDGEAKSKPSLQIPSEQRPNTSGKSRVDCDRCYKEILITLIMKRAYHDCPINWQRNYLPQDINFHVARICNGALDGPSWRNISEGTLDFPELLWCSTWHSDHRSQPLLLQSSVSSTTRHRPPRVLLMGKSQTDEERKAEQPTETSSVS